MENVSKNSLQFVWKTLVSQTPPKNVEVEIFTWFVHSCFVIFLLLFAVVCHTLLNLISCEICIVVAMILVVFDFGTISGCSSKK